MEKPYLDNIIKFTGCTGNYYNAHTCNILFDSIEEYFTTLKKSIPNTILFENIDKSLTVLNDLSKVDFLRIVRSLQWSSNVLNSVFGSF